MSFKLTFTATSGVERHTVDGRWEPFFPNATYYFPVTDFAVFKSRYESGERDLYGGPFADSVLPIVETASTRFVRDGDEIADCPVARAAPGHTEGQLIYSLHVAGEPEYIFTADVFHSPMQVLFRRSTAAGANCRRPPARPARPCCVMRP